MSTNKNLLAEFKKDFLGSGLSQPNPKVKRPDARTMQITDTEDYRRIIEMRNFYGQEGMRNPYFMERSGPMRDRISVDGCEYISYSGYNYLGLSDHQVVIEAAQQALARYGTHAGAARIVGGQMEIHRELEASLAQAFGLEDCVVSVGGYIANVMTISYLLGEHDLIIMDEYMHNSGVMGAVTSHARRMVFSHNDDQALEWLLKTHRQDYERALILVEGAYSMDGDLANLPRLIELKSKYNAWLMVDEAHSLGVVGKTGRGLCEHWGVVPSEVDLIMGTLSKSFASCGGFIGGSKAMIETLRHFAPGLLLYSTGLPPASAAAALAALQMMINEPERVSRLQQNIRRFAQLAKERGFNVGSAGASAVIPVMLGDTMLALQVMSDLLKIGVMAHAVTYPVVPREEARLRFFLTAQHTEAQFIYTLDSLLKILNRYQKEK
ncbi:MAG: aminotransferase class I/II-fold pyridoxal phosphate-dependent enzyme [Nitrospirota bacterium]